MKKSIIIYLLILNFISFGLHAQTTIIDSLKNLLQKHMQEDTIRVNLLNKTANKLRRIDIDKTLKYAKESGELADKLNFAKGKAKSLLLIGSYWSKSNPTKAFEFYQKSLKINKEIQNKDGISLCLYNIGLMYAEQSDYPLTLEYYQKSLKIAEEIGDEHGMSAILNGIGIIYRLQGNYSEALKYYERSMEISKKIGDKAVVSDLLNNIGIIYLKQDDYSQALKYFQDALKIKEEIGDKQGVIPCLDNIGTIYSIQKNYSQALKYTHRSLKISKELGDKKGMSFCLSNIGNTYANQGNYSQALNYTYKSLKIAIELNLIDHQKDMYYLLSEIYADMKNYKKAYKNYILYKELNDRIFNEKNIKKITGLEYKYEFDKEKQAIKLEQQKKDVIQAAEMKRQKQLRNAFIGGAIIFLILAIIIMRNLIQKRKANNLLVEKNEEIETQAEELKATNDKLLELDQFKEGMTGMIVHDLKNPLNAIINAPQSFSLEKQNANMKQSGKQMLNMVLNILDVHKYEDTRMTVDKVDHSLFELSQNAINEVSFLAKQKSIAITNSITTQLGVKCDKEVTERVFVNLLTNAIKYTPNSGAITLSANEPNDKSGLVKVQVTDSGQGIPKDKLSTVFDKFGQVSAKQSGGVRSTGLGLTFCKIAVEAHGGEILVESEISNGTSFIFTLPLGTKFEKVEAKEEIVQSKPKLILSNKDKELLKPYAKELSMLMVYQTSNVKKILDSIDYKESEFIENWITEVRDSLFAMNEEKFNDLINQIS